LKDTTLVFCRDVQQAGLIARTLRYREVNCLPVPFDTPAAEALAHKPGGIIIAGSCEPDALDGLESVRLSGTHLLYVPVRLSDYRLSSVSS